MKEKDPGKQKGLGKDKNIANFNETVWRQRCQEVMKVGLQAKFDQNPELKQFLLGTGINILIEANQITLVEF